LSDKSGGALGESVTGVTVEDFVEIVGAGWDPLMRFGQTTIRNKIIYGTGAFLINRPYTQLCDEMRALPLQRDVLDDWLWRNADHLLQHDG
jgi:uncharacterized protein